MSSVAERLWMSLKFWYNPRNFKMFYREGVSGSKYASGYRGGRLARERALRKRIRRIERRLDVQRAKLQLLVDERENAK